MRPLYSYKIEAALAKLTDRVDKMAEMIATLGQRIENLTKSINELAKTKAGHEEIALLEKRINILETKVATISQ